MTTKNQDLTRCPGCGGEADNGFDRCMPPNVYYCTKCHQSDSVTRVPSLPHDPITTGDIKENDGVGGSGYSQSDSVVDKMKEFYSTDAIPEEMKQALAFMRQWLNEDRKATPMVTARDLWHWLERDYNKARKQDFDDEEKAREGIKQGTFYGYDLVLMAPKDAVSDIINEHTLEQYIIDRYQSELDHDPVHEFFNAPEEVKRPVYEKALEKTQ